MKIIVSFLGIVAPKLQTTNYCVLPSDYYTVLSITLHLHITVHHQHTLMKLLGANSIFMYINSIKSTKCCYAACNMQQTALMSH